jgi:hypothetical protein
MEPLSSTLLTDAVLETLRALIGLHHSIYPLIPPQGIFFESLVAQAFRKSGYPRDQVVPSTPNSPQHDLSVGTARLSLKTETGRGTKRDSLTITKLCTTETGERESAALIQHTLRHLDRYDLMVMLRAIWEPRRNPTLIHYQFLEIPLALLRLMATATVTAVGTRSGRRSLGARVLDSAGSNLFRLHFDGADGKCQVHNLPVAQCRMLLSWDQPIES